MKTLNEIGRNPHIDWIVTMFISLTLAVILLVGGISLHTAVSEGHFQEPASPASPSELLENKSFSLVMERFAGKDEASQKARIGYTGPGDPSI